MFVSMILLVISSWEIVCGEEANDADGEVQRLSMNIPPRVTATYLRIRVFFIFHLCKHIAHGFSLCRYAPGGRIV